MNKLKIKELRGKNVLIKVVKQRDTTVKGGLTVKTDKTAFPTATIVALGDKADESLKVGMTVMCFAQSLGYSIDNEQLDSIIKDTVHDYFIIFDEQVDAILAEDEQGTIL